MKRKKKKKKMMMINDEDEGKVYFPNSFVILLPFRKELSGARS